MEGRNALVVEGGAMRGVFSTGVLDAFLERDFNPFDLCIGVSAGASNTAAYLAGMLRRNYRVYTDYSVRPQFINPVKFLLGGHLVDLDWLWEITIRELRLDIPKILSSGREFLIGVTEAGTGKPRFLQPSRENLEELLKASSSIPIFYRKFIPIDGTEYTDGGLSDPVPVMEAYRRGAVRIMVLRSRPSSFAMKPSGAGGLSRFMLRKHPAVLRAMEQRHGIYREAVEFMRNPPEGVRIIEANPPENFRTGRLTKDVEILNEGYRCGYDMGEKLMRDWDTAEINNRTKGSGS